MAVSIKNTTLQNVIIGGSGGSTPPASALAPEWGITPPEVGKPYDDSGGDLTGETFPIYKDIVIRDPSTGFATEVTPDPSPEPPPYTWTPGDTSPPPIFTIGAGGQWEVDIGGTGSGGGDLVIFGPGGQELGVIVETPNNASWTQQKFLNSEWWGMPDESGLFGDQDGNYALGGLIYVFRRMVERDEFGVLVSYTPDLNPVPPYTEWDSQDSLPPILSKDSSVPGRWILDPSPLTTDDNTFQIGDSLTFDDQVIGNTLNIEWHQGIYSNPGTITWAQYFKADYSRPSVMPEWSLILPVLNQPYVNAGGPISAPSGIFPIYKNIVERDLSGLATSIIADYNLSPPQPATSQPPKPYEFLWVPTSGDPEPRYIYNSGQWLVNISGMTTGGTLLIYGPNDQILNLQITSSNSANWSQQDGTLNAEEWWGPWLPQWYSPYDLINYSGVVNDIPDASYFYFYHATVFRDSNITGYLNVSLLNYEYIPSPVLPNFTWVPNGAGDPGTPQFLFLNPEIGEWRIDVSGFTLTVGFGGTLIIHGQNGQELVIDMLVIHTEDVGDIVEMTWHQAII